MTGASTPLAAGTALDAQDQGQIEAIVAARHGDPFAFLGIHRAGDGIVVRALLPAAQAMAVVDAATGEMVATGVRQHAAGFFTAIVPGRQEPFPYRLRRNDGGAWHEFDDIYRFMPVLGELDIHLLVEGNHLTSYQKLGAHPIRHESVEGVAFAVWAPSAQRVSVVGDFNQWDGRRMPMRRRHAGGFWEIFVPGLHPGHIYKYEIVGPTGELLPLKADPYARQAERSPGIASPGTASVVAAPSRHAWQDSAWMEERWRRNEREAPISIYEVHLGSWRRNLAEQGRYLSYRELAEQLVPYVKDLGFTHIEIMPATEYPFDGSWGYQPISLFAPTGRYGSPDDFRAFVDACHGAGLGLWLDWVPGHFPSDAHGLGRFDGTALYEHADPRQGLHRDWNTLIFNYGRREVANFLLSNALYWLREHHIDGLRVDAVASMLYLDYSRNAGEWVPNAYGGRENLEAIAFLRRMNELVFGDATGATTAAEESTAWPMVSRPLYVGGLGFGFKWNMGWMHDTLGYMSRDPIHRKYHHNDLTFGLLYAFQENFILPLSHDEVVHGKGSLIGKMPGDRWQRFANLRAYYAFMWTHPGKKLLFMGGEFAQEREWNHDIGLDWQLFGDPLHAGVHSLVRDLNRLYRTLPALHQLDCDPEGFYWIDAANAGECVLSYVRRGRDPDDFAVIVCNFTPIPRVDYRIGVPRPGRYCERLNTDAENYGGSGVGNAGAAEAAAHPMHGHAYSLQLQLPPLGVLIFTIGS
ncbi:MAG TPA: 1,4-alpha-glucan branching protein GlgB [Stellaceae bacterium]|jgi:1,4-alpha-glucan branching enzyme|nr:1,4-alpha-glucan branching protein GlgB [Stellaceae bacterium]